MLMAIEGIDGAGKGTLCKELMKLAKTNKTPAAALSFPRYEKTHFSELIGRYLRGEMGSIDSVPVKYAALLYGCDRFESREDLMTLINKHDLVILDRYIASNIAYSAAKLPKSKRANLIAWIEKLEYGLFDLPRPDLTLLLTTSTDVADLLVGQKGSRSYTDKKRDLHEANKNFLSIVTEVYEQLAKADRKKWLLIEPMDQNGKLLSPSQIAIEVWKNKKFLNLIEGKT